MKRAMAKAMPAATKWCVWRKETAVGMQPSWKACAADPLTAPAGMEAEYRHSSTAAPGCAGQHDRGTDLAANQTQTTLIQTNASNHRIHL